MKKPNTYTLRIIGSHPKKLPLDRLALYLAELAKLMGEQDSVHLDRVGSGSAALKVWAEDSAAQCVAQRIALAISNKPTAPREAIRALQGINDLLIEDGKKAELKDPVGAVIYPFPGGKKATPEKEMIIDEECSVTGQVIKIGGRDETIPVWLKDADGTEYHCTIRGGQLAREIATHYLGCPIEVSGKGKWRRCTDGKWTLLDLMVKSWTPLKDDWENAFTAMSQLASGWRSAPDVEALCAEIRKGI